MCLGDVPQLVTVVFGVGFPRDEQAVPVGGDFGAMAELFMNDGLFFGHVQALQELLKFLPALRTVQRRVGHVMGDVVNVRRHVEPFFQIFFGRCMQLPEKSLVGSRKVLIHDVRSGWPLPLVPSVMFYLILPNPLKKDQVEYTSAVHDSLSALSRQGARDERTTLTHAIGLIRVRHLPPLFRSLPYSL